MRSAVTIAGASTFVGCARLGVLGSEALTAGSLGLRRESRSKTLRKSATLWLLCCNILRLAGLSNGDASVGGARAASRRKDGWTRGCFGEGYAVLLRLGIAAPAVKLRKTGTDFPRLSTMIFPAPTLEGVTTGTVKGPPPWMISDSVGIRTESQDMSQKWLTHHKAVQISCAARQRVSNAIPPSCRPCAVHRDSRGF